ncbi:MAG: tetratricopeptide repeat protein [Sulfuritalea sp.]|nr:tetratricopeptide repeat protein [Sulfuritalea sp.]
MTLILVACGTTPTPVEPPRLKAALEAESEGAKRYGRGDYAFAARRFDEAIRLYASIDDAPGAARSRLHLARSELALGRSDAALGVLATAERSGDAGLALEILLLKAQAQLALDRGDAAQQSLAAATGHCAGVCPQAASLHLLQARAALAGQRAADALTHAETALKLLQGKDQAHETGNAWRLIAAARLAAGDAGGALPAAHTALDIDRRLALPEKIARDWLLIGDIRRRVGAGDTAAAYQRALDVANAAGLNEISMFATQALNDIGMQKKPSD